MRWGDVYSSWRSCRQARSPAYTVKTSTVASEIWFFLLRRTVTNFQSKMHEEYNSFNNICPMTSLVVEREDCPILGRWKGTQGRMLHAARQWSWCQFESQCKRIFNRLYCSENTTISSSCTLIVYFIKDGHTALFNAVVRRHLELCHLLLDKGANINETFEVSWKSCWNFK
jgi:hypothetical protein